MKQETFGLEKKKAPPSKPKEDLGLDTPVMYCPGVGPKRAQQFERMGIVTVGDLFWHLPRAYEDHHTLIPIRHLQEGQITTMVGTVVSAQERMPRNPSKVRHIFNVVIEDYSGTLMAVWFNQPFLRDKIKKGERISLHGKVERFDHYMQMSAPKYQIVGDDEGSTADILSMYPLSEGLTQGMMRGILAKALERFASYCIETLPEAVRQEYQFPNRLEAFLRLHQPESGDGAPTDVQAAQQNFLLPEGIEAAETLAALRAGDPQSRWERARRRLVFEELFHQQVLLRRYSENIKRQEGYGHPKPDPDPWGDEFGELDWRNPRHWPALFIKNLPFALTEDQLKVCQEIQTDMLIPAPMNRLLQGDVGSGKTAVSFYAMILAASAGMQAALLAPTEILAQQHANSFKKFTQGLPHLNAVLLTGSTRTADRREILKLIASGAVQAVIGTHAIFQEHVQFDKLSLVVVDEQHKFGVEQRQNLVEKGRHPDLLVATATPIPRTLSLTLFGDMDVSVIRSMPPGRPPIITRWTTWEKEAKVWEFVDEKIGEGQQAFVVCPIIENSEINPHLPSTEDAFERLSQTLLPNRRVAMLHGGHTPDEKQSVMDRMRAGEIDVVVSTTVIEVGVDIPNATIMVVMGADRFGLAQLHQLRGRVGRGTLKSYCILLTPPQISSYAEQRMRVLEKTRDGFVIAEEDLRLRGPGEQFGTRQSGRFRYHLADPFRDVEILQDARHAAMKLLKQDPVLALPEHQALKVEIQRQYGTAEAVRPS